MLRIGVSVWRLQKTPHLNPDWFYLSGTGLPRLSWKRGHRAGEVVLVVVVTVAVKKSKGSHTRLPRVGFWS